MCRFDTWSGRISHTPPGKTDDGADWYTVCRLIVGKEPRPLQQWVATGVGLAGSASDRRLATINKGSSPA
jgi:hypothetical protein